VCIPAGGLILGARAKINQDEKSNGRAAVSEWCVLIATRIYSSRLDAVIVVVVKVHTASIHLALLLLLSVVLCIQ
jgi:hypothetical protein